MDWLMQLLSGGGASDALLGGAGGDVLSDMGGAGVPPVSPTPDFDTGAWGAGAPRPPTPPGIASGWNPMQQLAGQGTPPPFPSLGQSLDPRPRPNLGSTNAQASSTTYEADRQGGGGGGQKSNNPLMEALRGLKQPPRPDVVKPSTPPPPRLMPVRGGTELLQLLQTLSQVRQPQRTPGMGLGQMLNR